jgi:hypothetical protein
MYKDSQVVAEFHVALAAELQCPLEKLGLLRKEEPARFRKVSVAVLHTKVSPECRAHVIRMIKRQAEVRKLWEEVQEQLMSEGLVP